MKGDWLPLTYFHFKRANSCTMQESMYRCTMQENLIKFIKSCFSGTSFLLNFIIKVFDDVKEERKKFWKT